MLLWGPMTVHDVLTHPLCWIVLAICIVAGIYVKRRVGKGLVFGIAAPLFLVPTWAVVSFCLLIPYGMGRSLMPDVFHSLQQWHATLPTFVGLFLSPSIVITATLFVLFCRSAREVDGLKPAGQAPGRGISAGASHNPFRKRIL